MNSELNEHVAESRVADWRRDADRFRQVHLGSGEPAEPEEAVTVRYARPTDAAAGMHRRRRWTRRRAISSPR